MHMRIVVKVTEIEPFPSLIITSSFRTSFWNSLWYKIHWKHVLQRPVTVCSNMLGTRLSDICDKLAITEDCHFPDTYLSWVLHWFTFLMNWYVKASPFMVLSARCGPRLIFPHTEQPFSFAINHIPELPIPVDHYCQYLVATFKLGMIE